MTEVHSLETARRHHIVDIVRVEFEAVIYG